MTKTGESWDSLTELFKREWRYVQILDNIHEYIYSIDHVLGLIKYNMNFKSDYKNYDPSDLATINEDPYRYQEFPNYAIEAEFTIQVPKESFYYFFASNWHASSESIKINYVVVNPGNEHLSYDLIPNKITYLIFFITWVIVLVISSIITGLRACYKKNVNYLSILILISFVFITSYWIVRYAYWMSFSKRGEVDYRFDLFVKMLEIAALFFYLVIINMVASGYRIVSLEFKFFKFIKNIFIIFLLVMTSLFMEYSNFFLMIFMAIEIVALVLILKIDINGCMKELRNSNADLNPEIEEERDFIRINTFKIKYYRLFMIYLCWYWALGCILLSLRPFLELYHEWIFTLGHQILNLVSMTYLFITLNYSIEVKKHEIEHGGALVMPLPFNPEKDPKICGEIIVIKSVNTELHPRITIGVECFNKATKRFEYESNPNLVARSKLYQTNNIDYETKLDIHGVINNIKKSAYNVIDQSNNWQNSNSNSDEDAKQVRDEESFGNSSDSFKYSNGPKIKTSNNINKDHQIMQNFTANKIIDFRSTKTLERFKKIESGWPITSAISVKKISKISWAELPNFTKFEIDDISSNQQSSLSVADPNMIEIDLVFGNI